MLWVYVVLLFLRLLLQISLLSNTYLQCSEFLLKNCFHFISHTFRSCMFSFPFRGKRLKFLFLLLLLLFLLLFFPPSLPPPSSSSDTISSWLGQQVLLKENSFNSSIPSLNKICYIFSLFINYHQNYFCNYYIKK